MKNKSVSIGKAYSRARYDKIVGGKKERKTAYHEIKENLQFSELCDAIDYLERSVVKERQELIWGKALPRDYSELGDLLEFPYLGEDVNPELNYCLIGIRKYKYEINLFLKYKETYEKHLLIGDYEKAEEQLTKIENEICFSLWALENRFVLKEISGKASENKEFLGTFNEINKSKGFTKPLAHYLSLRAEHSLSVNKYYNDLEISLNNLKESDTTNAFQNYYRFKLTFLNHIDFNNYAGIISLDFHHSIIDRYLNLVKVLTNLLAVSSYLQGDDERKKLLKSYLQNRINYLLRKIDDPVLYKLKLLSGETVFPAFNTKDSIKEVKIIDNYTAGLYDIAERELKTLLLEKPIQFDLYVLYIKSLIYQKKEFIPVNDKKSLQNEILYDLYKIISVKTNPDQASLNLLRIANNIASCQLSYGITDFVFFQTKGKEERKLLSRISYNNANPVIHDVFTDKETKERYLEILLSKFPDSVTVQLFIEKLKGLDYLKKYKETIPEGKFKMELAKKLQENKDYINAIVEWKFLTENYKETTPILETSIINLFECYLRLDQLDNCIDLLVDSFFFNRHIITKIEVGELLSKISSNKFRNVKQNINLPIFYTIVDADEVETHIVYELFNKINNVEKPSELLSNFENFEKNKFIYFLEFTCTPRILRHSTFIENSKERLEERLSIINFLKENALTNKEILSEIKNIENILVIQQGLIDLDESKIYVNEQGIIENELSDYEAVYNRYAIIANITDKSKILILKDGQLTTFSSKKNTKVERIEYSSNPVFDIYMELFNAVKDKFLNSQFGIVAYLSTRIRHGVLVGELRPVFETHNLITLKEGTSSNYRRNHYWDAIYSNLLPQECNQIQIILSDFASKIDGLIFDLIKKHLQVYKQEVNEDGWFNYEFDSNELWYHSIASINSSGYEDFIQRIFAVLWNRTDENLKFIRSQINTNILDRFNEYFNEFERNIINLLGDNKSQPLIKSIKDCSTEVQTVIQKISRWFKRSEIRAADFNLSELIDVVAEYTSKSSLQKRLVLEKQLDYNCKIKGDYKTHFADLIRNFLENIIKHSSESVSQIKCKIYSSYIDNDILRIEIQNEITDRNSLESLKSIWKNNTPDTEKLLSEGKSGYHKAFKILTSDLRCSKNECLSTRISDDEKLFTVILSINIKELKA